jgi:hypothetical protein
MLNLLNHKDYGGSIQHNSVRTSQRTHSVPTIKTIQLTLYGNDSCTDCNIPYISDVIHEKLNKHHINHHAQSTTTAYYSHYQKLKQSHYRP